MIPKNREYTVLACSGVKVFRLFGYFIKSINFKILATEHSNTQTLLPTLHCNVISKTLYKFAKPIETKVKRDKP